VITKDIMDYLKSNKDSNGVVEFSPKEFNAKHGFTMASVYSATHRLVSKGKIECITKGNSGQNPVYKLLVPVANTGSKSLIVKQMTANNPMDILQQYSNTMDKFVEHQAVLTANMVNDNKIMFRGLMDRLETMDKYIGNIKNAIGGVKG